MAGEGVRFKDANFSTPKPLIEVKGKTILEWTTKSLPFIKHNGESEINLPYSLTFAIRSEHDQGKKLSRKLKAIYGNQIGILPFDCKYISETLP